MRLSHCGFSLIESVVITGGSVSSTSWCATLDAASDSVPAPTTRKGVTFGKPRLGAHLRCGFRLCLHGGGLFGVDNENDDGQPRANDTTCRVKRQCSANDALTTLRSREPVPFFLQAEHNSSAARTIGYGLNVMSGDVAEQMGCNLTDNLFTKLASIDREEICK